MKTKNYVEQNGIERGIMTLHSPFIITPRLMAGLQIGGAFISMGAGPRNAEGRTQYGCYIDLPDGSEHKVTDLRSGCGGGDLADGFASLLSFLGAAAESYRYRQCDWNNIDEDDNASLFPHAVVEWAYQNSDELSVLQVEIEESEAKLIES
jgi:hypothetical protein